MVGDIKQSIYGFRLADPSLFLKKYMAYADETNPNQLIRLKENFRSRGEVLSFTNEVFKHLMDEEVGEMIYGKEEELVQGNLMDYPEKLEENFYPELLLYEEDTLEDESEQMSDGEIKGFAFRNQGSQHKHNPSYGRRERGYAGILRVCHSTYGQHLTRT